jgi:hypothetical protein
MSLKRISLSRSLRVGNEGFVGIGLGSATGRVLPADVHG